MNRENVLPPIREIDANFHGYVEDLNGIGRTTPKLEIVSLNLPKIECGLGSSPTGAHEKIPHPEVEYPDPFAKKESEALLSVLNLEEEVDPDQVIWRTSLVKLVDDVLRVLPSQEADINLYLSDPEDIDLIQKRNPRQFVFLSTPSLPKKELLENFLTTKEGKVVVADVTNLTDEDIKNLASLSANHQHLLILIDKDNQLSYESRTQLVTSNNLYCCLLGEKENLAYAILSPPLFEIYQSHRMVFMIPHSYREDPTPTPSSNYETSLSRTILERYGLNLSPERVLWGEGSYDLLDQLIALLPPLKILGLGSHFPYIEQLALRNNKLYSSFSPEDSFNLRQHLLRFIEYLSSNNIESSLLYIDTPSNPTGYVYSVQELRKLCQLAQEQSHLVIIDCAYGDLIEDIDQYYKLAAEFKNVVVLGSFSKVLGMAGERIGYAVMGEKIAQKVNPLKLPSFINQKAYERVVAALDSQNLNFHLESSRQRVRKIKLSLIESLNQLNQRLKEQYPFQQVSIQIATTHPLVSILFVRINGLEQIVQQSKRHYPQISLGRILEQRWNVTCEPGEEFTHTDPEINSTGFRLRIPSQVENIPQITKRVEDMIKELMTNPSQVIIRSQEYGF